MGGGDGEDEFVVGGRGGHCWFVGKEGEEEEEEEGEVSRLFVCGIFLGVGRR